MDIKDIILTAVLVVAAFVSGWALGNRESKRIPPPVFIERTHGREAEREEEQSPNVTQENQPPEVVYRWRTETVRDTICVGTPEDIAQEFSQSPAVTTQEAVGVRRPIFGDPSVTFRYYNPRDMRVEERVYAVRPHPFKYGLEGELVGGNLGLEGRLGGYLGWGPLQGVARGVVREDGLGYEVGVRVRFGR